MYQQRYWKELFQLKVHLNYLELYQQQSEKSDKILNIFLAITSSSSIAAWAIWDQYSFVWGLIIAASQALNAIKAFLPFKARLKALTSLLHELEELLIYTEMKWYDVSEGLLTEKEIHDLQYEIRKKKHQALRKHLAGQSLPEKKPLFSKANESTNAYFDNFYPLGEPSE